MRTAHPSRGPPPRAIPEAVSVLLLTCHGLTPRRIADVQPGEASLAALPSAAAAAAAPTAEPSPITAYAARVPLASRAAAVAEFAVHL